MAQVYRFGTFELRPAHCTLCIDGQAAALGSRAFDLLLALIERRDRVVPAAELVERVWPGLVVEENNLRQQIAALRKVLGAEAVVTVPGRGYRFTPDVDAVMAPASAASRPDQAEWFNELERISVKAEMAARIKSAVNEIDVTALLPQIKVPTLVMHAREDALVPFEAGRRLAAAIPGARFVPLEGRNHLFLESEPAFGQFLQHTREFLWHVAA